jgi:hypothetical protein
MKKGDNLPVKSTSSEIIGLYCILPPSTSTLKELGRGLGYLSSLEPQSVASLAAPPYKQCWKEPYGLPHLRKEELS